MAYDEGLAQRIREMLGSARVTEKKMFGGVAFLSRGHMFAGIVGDTLMARIGPELYADALREPHVREMDFTGRPMKGYVFVEPPVLERDDALERWIVASRTFVRSLPPK
jgi:TfoX/Sxy family transcriptional regulator of competence genes